MTLTWRAYLALYSAVLVGCLIMQLPQTGADGSHVSLQLLVVSKQQLIVCILLDAAQLALVQQLQLLRGSCDLVAIHLQQPCVCHGKFTSARAFVSSHIDTYLLHSDYLKRIHIPCAHLTCRGMDARVRA